MKVTSAAFHWSAVFVAVMVVAFCGTPAETALALLVMWATILVYYKLCDLR